MSEAGTAAPARDPGIDLMRGVAIGVVLLLHFSLTYRLAASPAAALLTPAAVRAVVNNGNFGVTIFFAVSGFLITANTLRRAGRLAAVDVAGFYVLRAARILPSLVLAVATIVALGLLGAPSFGNRADGHALPDSFFVLGAVSVLTFTHNLLMQSVGYFNYCLNIYWSMSVEEAFYLAFPLLCAASARRNWIVAACLVAVAAGPLYRYANAADEIAYLYAYAACFDAIAFGCLAALAADRVRLAASPARWGAATCAIALAVAYLRGIAGHEVFGFTAVAAAAAGLLFCNASLRAADRRSPRRWSAPIRWAGRHSYELYLFHIVVLACLRDVVPRDQLGYAWKLPWLGVYLALSAAVAALVARFVSEPANAALRHRFFTGRTPPRDAAARAAGPRGAAKELS